MILHCLNHLSCRGGGGGGWILCHCLVFTCKEELQVQRKYKFQVISNDLTRFNIDQPLTADFWSDGRAHLRRRRVVVCRCQRRSQAREEANAKSSDKKSWPFWLKFWKHRRTQKVWLLTGCFWPWCYVSASHVVTQISKQARCNEMPPHLGTTAVGKQVIDSGLTDEQENNRATRRLFVPGTRAGAY